MSREDLTDTIARIQPTSSPLWQWRRRWGHLSKSGKMLARKRNLRKRVA